VPGAKAFVRDAVPPDTGALPSTSEPSRNHTVPVASLAPTVLEKVTVCPASGVGSSATIATDDVPSWPTSTSAGTELLGANVGSPR
jgi:hypothetical protein